MNHMKQTITLLTAALILAGTCSSCAESETAKETDTAAASSPVTTEAVTEPPEPDPLEGLDFGGEPIRMLVSANNYDGFGTSSVFIKSPAEETGDIVLDAVYRRNEKVKELLNVDFVFTDNNDDYRRIGKFLRNTLMAGDDLYDLIIHDLIEMSRLSIEGYCVNVLPGKYFDFSKDYWYGDYMKDAAFGSDEKRYLLAGDYFMDILRSAHALYFNKTMFTSIYDSADALYQHVYDGTWTHDVFYSYIKDVYQDLNGNGEHDIGDRYGFGYVGKGGTVFPWAVSADLNFVTYAEDGHPSFALNDERSIHLLDNLNKMYYDDSAIDYEDVKINEDNFTSGKVLFSGYHRVCSLEIFRGMEADIGLVPYPKMDEQQKSYLTSTHDTANIGFVPMTSSKLDTTSAVLEALSRETAASVMPAYYETALKVKYSRDDDTANMLDIIRYHVEDVFPLALGGLCANLPVNKAFMMPLQKHNNDFVSNYQKFEAKGQAKLDELWGEFSALEP